MNKMHYSLDEISPLWLILLGIFLLVQGTWIFQDARRRGRFPWLWGLWGITGFPTPLIIYWFVVIRSQRKPSEPKK
ncbi:sigmaY antisigma factor component [Paenibacillus sp. 1781tsa1]|uniref:sigmaY antisigma factor component n=1 Tax=Paenibacillus sp. 1781tsa1 TaxID=2953810 RepID=UPI00209DEF9C|nr:sigmaY antisigma factor component [Paenibacillus sp. 1781tsa1]MCP1186624.1 sigmaY antisigma factor component [Paenibacillus sp. 1781tsa1]